MPYKATLEKTRERQVAKGATLASSKRRNHDQSLVAVSMGKVKKAHKFRVGQNRSFQRGSGA